MNIKSSAQARHHWIRLVALNCRNRTPFTGHCVRNTGPDGLAIQQNGARATDTVFAAKMGARKLHNVTQKIAQMGAVRDRFLNVVSVNR